MSLNLRDSDDEDIRRAVKPRRLGSRKGENGVVLVVGGSWLYHGAPILSSLAAMRAGVDLVYLAVPEKISVAARAYSPNLIVLPLPDQKLTRRCVERIYKVLSGVDAAVVGPGLAAGSEQGIIMLVEKFAAKGISAVLDATSLFPGILKLQPLDRFVLTPHAGEFRRLFGREVGHTLEERSRIVAEEAAEHDTVILNKGRVDVVADRSQVVLNRTGTPAMTVGGTGDVLAGLVAGLMALKASPFEAAVAAARANGLAGEKVTAEKGFHITASEVAEMLPHILKPFDTVAD